MKIRLGIKLYPKKKFLMCVPLKIYQGCCWVLFSMLPTAEGFFAVHGCTRHRTTKYPPITSQPITKDFRKDTLPTVFKLFLQLIDFHHSSFIPF
jgi:hypothetical protein